MTAHRILFMVCGQPPEHVEEAFGGYLRWFSDAMGPQVSLVPWDVRHRPEDPDLREFAGMVISGGPASLTQPEPWMENAIELIRQAAETALPVLGICLGHQLIGCAFGAPTVKAADDGEHGTHQIALNELGKRDPLFANMPGEFRAQLTHYDEVDPMAVSFSNGLRVLATSAGCAVQALAAGDTIRSVQYHPEFTQPLMQRYLDERDKGPPASDCEHAVRIFQNWVHHWIARDSN